MNTYYLDRISKRDVIYLSHLYIFFPEWVSSF